MRYQFSLLDVSVLVALVAIFTVAMIVGARYERLEQRRRAAWQRQYFKGGGLVRSLMARWTSVPKLTDRRSDKDKTDEKKS